MIRWPWTSLQALNLDWILSTLKSVVEKVNAYSENITASATTGAAGTNASVTVTGDLDTGLDFAFMIPRGNTGATGPEGPEGPEGQPGQPGQNGSNGESFKILGLVATTADLPSGAAQGDCYAVGTAASNSCYIWDGSAWVNIGNSMSAEVIRKNVSTGSDPGYWRIRKCGNVYSYDLAIAPLADISSGTILASFTYDSDIPTLPTSAVFYATAAGRDGTTPGYPTDFAVIEFNIYTTYASVTARSTLKAGYNYQVVVSFL